ncbi:MAG: metal-dependent transcriptional regulator [Planctomycetaceae bacterium]|nr:metal-dependent transcriptional regulator [Planctomycetaceae bacterium]
MPSLTVENYLKAALQIASHQETPWVSTGQLAAALAVSPGTVTSMLKSLSDSGLAEYRPYEGVSLTPQGRGLALRMLRRHRLIELFLVKTLNLTWDQVHEEAEHMEHAVSDFLVDRIDDFLDHPNCDPHGDPIPAADGTMRGVTIPLVSLATVAPGTSVRIARVTNQEGNFLRFLADSGLQIDQELTVLASHAAAGCVTVDVNGRPISIGLPAAADILVVGAGVSH